MRNYSLKSNQQGITLQNSRDITNPVYLSWLGGFVEGEGSVSVSIVVNQKFKFPTESALAFASATIP